MWINWSHLSFWFGWLRTTCVFFSLFKVEFFVISPALLTGEMLTWRQHWWMHIYQITPNTPSRNQRPIKVWRTSPPCWPLHRSRRFSRAGQVGVEPCGSKVTIRPVLSWKLDQTNCLSVNSDYSRIWRKLHSPFQGPWHRLWVGDVGVYYRWKIKLCMLQCTGHKSKITI